MLRRSLKILIIFLLVVMISIMVYASSTIGVDEEPKKYLVELKEELNAAGLRPSIWVISGRRWKLDNWLLTKLSGAASNSQHLQGKAIDIVVLDVNDDGEIDGADVDSGYEILDKKIIRSKGGIGTYKSERNFFSRQMIHFDCRGSKARWNR